MGKTIVVLLGLLGWGALAEADSITLLNDGRQVTVLARVSEAGTSDQQTDSQGPGDALTATASASTGSSTAQATARLFSSIADPAHLGGAGSTMGAFFTSGEGEISAKSLFQIDLLLDTPFVYAFNGNFAISDFPARSFEGFNEARWSAVLSSDSGFNAGDSKGARVSFAGVLPAGFFHFLVGTSADGFFERGGTVVEDASFDFALDLAPLETSPTPEPASLLLLGTAVAGLVARRSLF